MTELPECEPTRELIPELAAGVAAGNERARALSHLAGCPDCQRWLAATADVVDELLLLAPEREPPAGLESAVLAALAPASGHRWRTPLLWVASVVVTAVLAGGILWWRTADDRELAANYRRTLAVAHGSDLRAAALADTDGANSGAVFAYQGSPSWVYVTFRQPPAPGDYAVRLHTDDGRQVALRPFTARRNAPAWGSTINLPIRAIRRIEFVRAGVPVLSALFTP